MMALSLHDSRATRRSNANCAQTPIRKQRASEIAPEMDPAMCQMSHSIRKDRLDHRSESRHRRNSRLRMVLSQMPYLWPTTLEQACSRRNGRTTAITVGHCSCLCSTLESEQSSSVVGKCVWGPSGAHTRKTLLRSNYRTISSVSTGHTKNENGNDSIQNSFVEVLLLINP